MASDNERQESVVLQVEISEYRLLGYNRVLIRRTEPGKDYWAVIYAPYRLRRTGLWTLEPSPSRRTETFKKRTRFNSVEEATAAALKAVARNPQWVWGWD